MEGRLLIVKGGTPEAEATFNGQLVILRMKRKPTMMGGCCTLGVCCTWC